MPFRISAGHSRVTNGGVLDNESVTLSTSTWTSILSASISVGMASSLRRGHGAMWVKRGTARGELPARS
jgi:hypothetical protein